jgi:hypothetical protein
MRTCVLLVVLASPWCVSGEDLSRRYAEQGELILAQFNRAPFPHPARAGGFVYKDKTFSAEDHYSDSTVAVFVPKAFRETGRIDFLVHFHGWNNHVEQVLSQYQLIEQFTASRRNAILVVPQGPRDASDSFGGKLEDAGGFKAFMVEVLATLRDRSRLKNKAFTPGKIILSGHSGGYRVISAILERGGMGPEIKEVWLFDALYGQTEKFLNWFDRGPGRMLNIYTEDGGTKSETQKLMATLKARGTPFAAGKEGELPRTDLERSRAVFLFTELPHNDVLHKHQTFGTFLETSCLETISVKGAP